MGSTLGLNIPERADADYPVFFSVENLEVVDPKLQEEQEVDIVEHIVSMIKNDDFKGSEIDRIYHACYEWAERKDRQ